MIRRLFPHGLIAALAALATTAALARDAGQINVLCSVQAEWCNMIQTVFAKSTGIKVNMSLKGSGEALAQLIAERANPKTMSGSAAPAIHTCRRTSRICRSNTRARACRNCTPGRSSRRRRASTVRWESIRGHSASATTPS